MFDRSGDGQPTQISDHHTQTAAGIACPERTSACSPLAHRLFDVPVHEIQVIWGLKEKGSSPKPEEKVGSGKNPLEMIPGSGFSEVLFFSEDPFSEVPGR